MLEDHNQLATTRDRTYRALIRNFKTVITFDADNYIPGTEVAIADKHLSMTGMQLIVSVDGKKVKEEIRYRSRYEQ